MFLTRKIRKLIEAQYRAYFAKQEMSQEWRSCIEYIINGYKRISQDNMYYRLLQYRYGYGWSVDKIALKTFMARTVCYEKLRDIMTDTLFKALQMKLKVVCEELNKIN